MERAGSDRVRLREAMLEWREVEGEIVALDLERSTYVAINPTGAVVWRSLAEGATVQDLVTQLTEAFEVDEPTAAADVSAFLDSLEEQGLVEQPAG